MPEQFGFRRKHNTTHQLLRVVEILSKALHKNIPAGAIFLDVAKAYDKIPHNHLLYKLIKMNFPKHTIHLIKTYLQNRQFNVRLQSSYSSYRPTEASLQQGSILAPTLYSLYTYDCPRADLTSLSLFADDTGLVAFAPHRNSVASYLQAHLDDLDDWFIKWKIKVNPDKSHAVYFSTKYKLPPDFM